MRKIHRKKNSHVSKKIHNRTRISKIDGWTKSYRLPSVGFEVGFGVGFPVGLFVGRLVGVCCLFGLSVGLRVGEIVLDAENKSKEKLTC